MIDELTEEDDGRIAAHIVALHKNPGATIAQAPFTMEQLQRYIKYARAIKPRLSAGVSHNSIRDTSQLSALRAYPAEHVAAPQGSNTMLLCRCPAAAAAHPL